MNQIEQFWNASIDELKRGYTQEEDHYICLLCGEKVEKGLIYPVVERFYDAERYMRHHINGVHQSVFDHLIQLDKKETGLSDHQNRLLQLFFQGLSDAEIQKEMGIGSASTIRNHRFALKEKERQAKIFLVLMELLKEKDQHAPRYINVHKTATMVDERYDVSQVESDKIIKNYFPEGIDGPLKTFSMKEKNKLVVLHVIARRLQDGRMYDEKEINQILKVVYSDFVTLRRYLIEYGFLDRTPDGSRYWLKTESTKEGGKEMNRREELLLQFKETKTEAGVYQIKNTRNQKVFIDSTMNLKTINGKQFQLRTGMHKNKELQKEWQENGEEAFEFEVLETLKIDQDRRSDTKDALKKLEEKWIEQLQPFGERGYHHEKKK